MVQAGIVSEEVISTVDLYAILAEVLDVNIDKNTAEDSYSIVLVLMGEKSDQSLRKATVYHSFAVRYAIRKDKWKYIDKNDDFSFTSLKGELYNVEIDPMESVDLFGEEPIIVAEMQALLDQYKNSGRSVKR